MKLCLLCQTPLQSRERLACPACKASAQRETIDQIQPLVPILELLERATHQSAGEQLKALDLFQNWLANYQQTMDLLCRELESLDLLDEPERLPPHFQIAEHRRLVSATVESVENFNDLFRHASTVQEFKDRLPDLPIFIVLMRRAANAALSYLTGSAALGPDRPGDGNLELKPGWNQ